MVHRHGDPPQGSALGQHSFASDDYAGVHPDVLAAIAAVNTGHMSSYGADPVTADAVAVFRRHLGEQAEVAFVLDGTGTNVVGLNLLLTKSSIRRRCRVRASIRWTSAGPT